MFEISPAQPRDKELVWRLRAARHAAGLTQAQLAAATYTSRSTIACIETGRQNADRDFWTRADQATSANGTLIATYDRIRDLEQRTAKADPASVVERGLTTSTADLIGRVSKEDLAMDRREAARAIAGLLLGAPLLERVEGWLATDEPQPARRRVAGIGYQEVEQLEHTARVFRAWDNQFGGGLRRKAVVGQLAEVADELRDFSHPPELSRRLHGVMAQLACIAATMSWDSEQGAAAQQYYLVALRAAAAARDRAFAANVLAGMARQQFYLGHVADGLELVRLAQDRVDRCATPAVRAMLYTREAWAYALQGRLAAFRRVTSRAEDWVRDVEHGSEPYWIGYFNEAELAGVTGGRLLDVAHGSPNLAEEAATWLQQAVALRGTEALRSAALDQIGFAEIRLIQGECDEASRLGHHALDTVALTQSSRVRVKLAELYRFAAKSKDSAPPMAELCERIRPILRSPRPQPSDSEEQS